MGFGAGSSEVGELEFGEGGRGQGGYRGVRRGGEIAGGGMGGGEGRRAWCIFICCIKYKKYMIAAQGIYVCMSLCVHMRRYSYVENG